MKISVIIPVYNAARYLREAVGSALSQKEVGEVVLIEDGSLDNSLDVCNALVEEYKKVKLFRHRGGVNKGAGISRNLGVKKAVFDFIAFLDADDFYLPERFTIPEQKFGNDPELEGVYEAIGFYFEDGNYQKAQQFMDKKNLTTMTEVLSPEELFFGMSPIGNKGHFSVDGLVLKKEVFLKVGWFSNLPIHEDTAFLVRLTSNAKLEPGRIDSPVAMRRVHRDNRITGNRSIQEEYNNGLNMWLEIWDWSLENKLSRHKKRIIFYHVLIYVFKKSEGNSSENSFIFRILKLSAQYFYIFKKSPNLFWGLFMVRLNDILRYIRGDRTFYH